MTQPPAKTIRKAKGWRLAAGNLMWVVLSLQAASIGQIPVFLCCLGLLLTPLLVTWILPCWFLRRVIEGSPGLLVVLIRAATLCGDPLSILLWKQDGHATQSHIVKRRKLRVPYVRKN